MHNKARIVQQNAAYLIKIYKKKTLYFGAEERVSKGDIVRRYWMARSLCAWSDKRHSGCASTYSTVR